MCACCISLNVFGLGLLFIASLKTTTYIMPSLFFLRSLLIDKKFLHQNLSPLVLLTISSTTSKGSLSILFSLLIVSKAFSFCFGVLGCKWSGKCLKQASKQFSTSWLKTLVFGRIILLLIVLLVVLLIVLLSFNFPWGGYLTFLTYPI